MNLQFKLGSAYLKLIVDCRLSEIHLNNGLNTVDQALYKEFISIVLFTFKTCQMRKVSIQHTDINIYSPVAAECCSESF